LPCGRLFDEILAAVQAFAAGGGFADDVCIVGMEFRADPAARIE
jgi:hypothetical protein